MLSPSQARIVDPVLTNHAQGFKHPQRVGHILFPRVPVPVAAGKVIEFDKASFKLYSARRAPGGATKRIDFGYLGKPFELEQDSLEGKVPRELHRDAEKVPGINLGMRVTDVVMKTLTLSLEYEQAQLATDIANYDAQHKITLAGSSLWSDKAGSDPIADVETGREAIRASTGFYPNAGVIGPGPFKALKQHPAILDRLKYTSSESVTVKLLAGLFDLDRLEVGAAVTADDADAFSDVWGNNLVMAYAPENPNGPEEPSYGYTYAMENHPFVEPPYYDGNTKSWIYGVSYERIPVLTGITAGYIIQNAS